MLTMLTQTHRAVMDGSINRVYRACGAAGGQLAVGADPGLNTLVTLLRPSRHRCRSRADPAPLRRHAHWDLRVAAEFGSRRACARPRGRGCPVPAPGDCSALEDSWFMFLGEGAGAIAVIGAAAFDEPGWVRSALSKRNLSRGSSSFSGWRAEIREFLENVGVRLKPGGISPLGTERRHNRSPQFR
jgi:hypothetical protein